MTPAADPYRTLGVDPSVSDDALHDAYRRLVKNAHPDRNGGTAEATRRFVQIQAAYDQITAERRRSGPARTRRPGAASTPRPPAGDPAVESRLADLERQVREARVARERAAQAAREAVREVQGDEEIHLPADEEDSFSKLLEDAATHLGERIDEAREHPTVRRATEMLAGLEWLASAANAERSRGADENAGDDGREEHSRGGSA